MGQSEILKRILGDTGFLSSNTHPQDKCKLDSVFRFFLNVTECLSCHLSSPYRELSSFGLSFYFLVRNVIGQGNHIFKMICGEEWVVYLLKKSRKRFGCSDAAEFNSNCTWY